MRKSSMYPSPKPSARTSPLTATCSSSSTNSRCSHLLLKKQVKWAQKLFQLLGPTSLCLLIFNQPNGREIKKNLHYGATSYARRQPPPYTYTLIHIYTLDKTAALFILRRGTVLVLSPLAVDAGKDDEDNSQQQCGKGAYYPHGRQRRRRLYRID